VPLLYIHNSKKVIIPYISRKINIIAEKSTKTSSSKRHTNYELGMAVIGGKLRFLGEFLGGCGFLGVKMGVGRR